MVAPPHLGALICLVLTAAAGCLPMFVTSGCCASHACLPPAWCSALLLLGGQVFNHQSVMQPSVEAVKRAGLERDHWPRSAREHSSGDCCPAPCRSVSAVRQAAGQWHVLHLAACRVLHSGTVLCGVRLVCCRSVTVGVMYTSSAWRSEPSPVRAGLHSSSVS